MAGLDTWATTTNIILYLLTLICYVSIVACGNFNESEVTRSGSSKRAEMKDSDRAVSLLYRGRNTSGYCSPWFDCGDTDWLCDKIPHDIFKCSDHQRVSILTCHCATYNDAKDVIEVGKCIYNTLQTLDNQFDTIRKNFRLLKTR